jgi:hypothetical protein
MSSMNIITTNGTKYVMDRRIMSARFELVDTFRSEYPCEDLHIELDDVHFQLVIDYTSTLLAPTTKEDWLHLLHAANYLLLTHFYKKVLLEQGMIYAKEKGATFKKNIDSLTIISEKIKDPYPLNDIISPSISTVSNYR